MPLSSVDVICLFPLLATPKDTLAPAGPVLAAGDPDKWDALLQLNLGTPLRLTRRLAPKMAGKPNHSYIINISSIAGSPSAASWHAGGASGAIAASPLRFGNEWLH